MTDEDLRGLHERLRQLHRAERRRAWFSSRRETLVLSATFLLLAWLLWNDHTALSAFLGAFGLVLGLAALI